MHTYITLIESVHSKPSLEENQSVARVAAVEVIVTVLLAELLAASFLAFVSIRALGGAKGILIISVGALATVLLAELLAASFHAFLGISALGGAICILAD